MGHAAFYRYVKSKSHSFPAGSPLYGASQEFERCNKESEVFMRKRIITLLLGLMAATALLTVTAWAVEPTLKLSKQEAQKLIGSITLQCSEHQNVLNFTDIARITDFSLDPEPTAADNYVGKLKVNAVPFVDYWNGKTNDDPHHIITGEKSAEFDVKYTASEGWTLIGADGKPVTDPPGVIFYVSCQKPEPPALTLLKDAKVYICLANTSTYNPYTPQGNWYDANISDKNISWNNDVDNVGAWECRIPVDVDAILKQYAQDNGGSFVAPPDSCIWLKYSLDNPQWVPWYGNEPAADIYALPAPTLDDLKGITVNINCKDGSHAAKSFALTSFGQLSGSWIRDEFSYEYEYHLTLTNAAAKDFVAQYGADVGKTHSLDGVTGQMALTWYQPGGGVTVYANADPVEAEPEEKWVLVGDNTFTITAACVPDTPQDNTTTTTRPRRKPAAAPVQADDTTISSAKTFDGGIALYAGLTLLSTTGAALLHRKKDN